MKADPSHQEYVQRWSELYEDLNYNAGMAGYFLKKSHAWCEERFTVADHFSRVIEVGAGSGVHLAYVRHGFDEYIMTDLNPPMLDKIAPSERAGCVLTAREDASSLSFADASFDRLIATHVLEHLVSPHEVLREWARVLKPGGTMTLVLPCDPGLGWRLGRAIGSRSKFIKAGIEYDYWMAREHVNPINNLVPILRYYFEDIDEQWLPMRVPSMDVNLFYIAHVRV